MEVTGDLKAGAQHFGRRQKPPADSLQIEGKAV